VVSFLEDAAFPIGMFRGCVDRVSVISFTFLLWRSPDVTEDANYGCGSSRQMFAPKSVNSMKSVVVLLLVIVLTSCRREKCFRFRFENSSSADVSYVVVGSAGPIDTIRIQDFAAQEFQESIYREYCIQDKFVTVKQVQGRRQSFRVFLDSVENNQLIFLAEDVEAPGLIRVDTVEVGKEYVSI
jgi:hypothetical protein